MVAGESETRTADKRRSTTNAKGEPLKQERAARTRQSVLEAAAELFAVKGFPAVTVLDVAERTGLTKGAVYFHFTNKEAIAVAVAHDFYGRIEATATALLREERAPLEQAIEFVRRLAVLFRDDRVIQAGARLQLERPYIDSSLPTPYVGALDALTGILVEAGKAGQLPPGADPEALARVLLSAFFGAQHMSWVLSDRADLPDRVEEILRAVFPGHLS